jgi:hypothetical protein
VDLVLHIGTEKTGSTSIQHFLAKNRLPLREAGILFPRAPGLDNQRALTVIAEESTEDNVLRSMFGVRTPDDLDRFRADLRQKLWEELAAGGCSRVVMSNEHCSSRLRHPLQVEYLRTFLSEFFDRIRILVYIRRQDDFLVSTYSTMVKTGRTVPIEVPRTKAHTRRYDHWVLLSLWAKVFGRENIICRRYDRADLVEGDVIHDFGAQIGIPKTPDFERPGVTNESLDADALEFLRVFNRYFNRTGYRSKLIKTLAAISNGPLVTLPEKELADFMACFRESNEMVALEYLGGTMEGSDDPLFPARSDKRVRSVYEPLTVDKAVQIAALLWQHELPPLAAEGAKGEMQRRLTELRAQRAERRELRMAKKKSREAREQGKAGVPEDAKQS